jgi:hypothetical protein
VVSNASGSYGLATGVSIGTPSISATIGSISGSTTLTVTAPLLLSIAVSQSSVTNPNIALGLNVQYTAIGTYTDHTGPLTGPFTWASSNILVATIDSSGLAVPVAYGTTTITATDTGSSMVGSANTQVIASFQYGSSVYSILAANCAGSSCHSASAGPPVLPSADYWTLYDLSTSSTPASATQATIVANQFNGSALVNPGTHATSTFYLAPCSPSPPSPILHMPPLPATALSSAQCTIIGQWIDEGAHND